MLFYILEFISKTLKGKMLWRRGKLCIAVKADCCGNTKMAKYCTVFVFLSGKTKQLSLPGNYWALLSIYGNLIYATESTCFGSKMATCFSDMKDEESSVRRTRKLSARCLHQFEQQPEGKALFKSNFSHELGEMKEIIFTLQWNPNITILDITMYPV